LPYTSVQMQAFKVLIRRSTITNVSFLSSERQPAVTSARLQIQTVWMFCVLVACNRWSYVCCVPYHRVSRYTPCTCRSRFCCTVTTTHVAIMYTLYTTHSVQLQRLENVLSHYSKLHI